VSKEVIFHINNMAYTITVDEEIYGDLSKYIDLERNNDVKDLLVAYLRITQEYHVFKKDVDESLEKLSRF